MSYLGVDSDLMLGNWWHPSKPDKQVCGLLLREKSKFLLKLDGDIYPEQNIWDGENLDIVLGRLRNGKKIALFDLSVFGEHKERWVDGVREEFVKDYLVDRVIIGKHFSELSTVKINRFRIHYSNLEKWMDSQIFKIYPKCYDEQGFSINNLMVKHRMPEITKVGINNDDLSFYFTSSCSIDVKRDTHAKLEHTSFVVFESISGQNLDYFEGIAEDFKMILSLLMQHPVSIMEAAFCLNEENSILDDYYPILYANKSTITTKYTRGFYNSLSYRILTRNNMDYFTVIIQNWFKYRDLLESTLRLYTAGLFVPEMYREFHFLSLIQAIESYARAILRDNNKYMTEEDYSNWMNREIVPIINEARNKSIITKSHKDSLMGALKHGYEYSLRKYLKVILNELCDYDNCLKDRIDDIKLFIGRIVDIRNTLTHNDPNSESVNVDSSEFQEDIYLRSKVIVTRILWKRSRFAIIFS